MDSRRIAALNIIERVRRYEVENEARELGRLRADAALLDRRREDLDRQLHNSALTQDHSLLAYAGDFRRFARTEMTRIERLRARMEPDITRLEDRVAETFLEIKSYEILRLNAMARQVAEERKREDGEAAEMALIQWWRDQQAEG